MIKGLVFGDVGCHATSKGSELIYDLDYVISFWLWILSAYCENIHISLKYPCSVDIIRIFVDISTFRGYYLH